jgi:uncharacterized protein involved in exopolysaccharide biosynthesis
MNRLNLLLHFWRLKWMLVACAAIGLAGGVVHAHFAKPLYAIDMTIGPRINQSQPTLGNLFSSSGIAGQLFGGAQGSPAYTAFMQKLTSADAAEAVARNSDVMQTIFKPWWDPAAKAWRTEQHGIVASARAMLGLPAARPPTAYELGRYLRSHIKITPIGKTTINRIELRANDPAFGVELLRALTVAADKLAKDEERTRLEVYLKKIDDLLATVRPAEIRAALTELYARSEEERLLILEDQLYSASIIDNPRASSSPVSPSLLTIAEFGGVGLLLGVCGIFAYLSFALLSASLAAGLAAKGAVPLAEIPDEEEEQAIFHARRLRS